MLEGGDPELALIVGAARSGTTLLRVILDAHPEIGCPAEAGLPSLMSHMATVWSTIDADVVEDAPVADPGQKEQPGLDGRAAILDGQDPTPENPVRDAGPQLPAAALGWIRTSTVTAMRRYCDREQKRLYVDKSLDSVYHLPLVDQLYPELRCVLAFRHVMDTIASGIDASPWGFQAYGYAPYVQTSPGNSVAALARYWLDHVTGALEWEKQHPERCIRVRYEDLVQDPEQMVPEIQRFLGVREDLSVLQSAFDREPLRGPGDYKVEHTTAVHAASVGHGKRVPVDMLPPPLLSAVNEKLEALGYPALDRSWNTAERAIDVAGETLWSRRIRELMSQARLPANHTEVGPFAVVAEDHRALRWIFDPETSTITNGDGDVEAVLTGTAEDLVLMLIGDENLGGLLRTGRIRHLLADDEVPRSDTRRELYELVTILRTAVGDVTPTDEPTTHGSQDASPAMSVPSHT
jgi:hypothetical protein